MQISNLRHQPSFAEAISNRVWHAWWTESGISPQDFRAGFNPMLGEDVVPFALVAHEGETYCGSVLVIENDLDERPQLAPWIAALWVDPEYRKQGVAAELISRARQHAAALGYAVCYLCATTEKRPYYLKQGFTLLEENVTGLDVFSIEAV
ncbi:GNAT family N-acetyltransferase [uncultured Agrobacterium sp.]|uniref:GNAT family N-acetyltransferase n=1 Tax=uncultured Agrobacterium sp. TaxID=157277 RepID=UPI0025879EC7|nr:GNAT family N-acetyltransferase [uncultured Agrobacterium sp.]